MAREDENLETTEQDTLRADLEAAFDTASEADDASADEADAGDLDTHEESGQPRDERGRWTKAQQEHYEAQQREQQEVQGGEGEKVQDQDLRLLPPIGWSPAARAAFADLPPEVKEAVARREMEVNNGLAKLRDYKELDGYAEMARSSGTTLKEALDRYKAAEDLLDRDFRGGVLSLCEMYGVHPMQLANEFASMFVGQQQGQQPRGAMDPNTALIARELQGMKETVRTLISEREQQEREAINSHVLQFSENKEYFEDVRRDMADLIRAGKADTLEDAYEKACWMNPQIRDLLIKQQAAPQEAEARVSKARRASGSLPTGAPAGNSQHSSANTIRAALEEAWGNGAL